MTLLSRNYLYSWVSSTKFKLIHFTIIYNISRMLSYTFFFNLKALSVKSRNYRIYLLNTSFYFLFIDYIYVINYFKYLNKDYPMLSVLPIKTKTYSILRSPFVYSKSREDLSVQAHFFFFDINSRKLSEAHFFFYNKLLCTIRLDNSKIWYKCKLSL